MSGDAVFPIPEPTFLWVHALSYVPHDGDNVVTDSEGRWRYDTAAAVEFTGYITAPNPRDVARAAAQDVIIDAVALAPLSCAITEQCSLTAPATVPRGPTRGVQRHPDPPEPVPPAVPPDPPGR